MIGRVIKLISNDYTVLLGDEEIICKSRGKFRHFNLSVKVGDFVKVDVKQKYILDILDRKNELVRPPVSNIDQVIIITSVKDPDFSTNLLDKLLTIVSFNNIKPVILFTKLDLLNKEELKEMKKYSSYYSKFYTVYYNDKTKEFEKCFKDKITVFTGQSGAGKSTLLNKLNPNFKIKTDKISYALGRGKHTTRHVELLPLFDGFVADTPGFSDIEFNDMREKDIRDNFEDFNKYRDQCKYKDCLHDKEDHCKIKELVEDGTILKERYQNYIKFINGLPKIKY